MSEWPDDELLPCPFCGGKALATYSGFASPSYFIECEVCACRTPAGPESSRAAIWNRRAADTSSAPISDQE
jgi:Lar family restriction alleviation protein